MIVKRSAQKYFPSLDIAYTARVNSYPTMVIQTDGLVISGIPLFHTVLFMSCKWCNWKSSKECFLPSASVCERAVLACYMSYCCSHRMDCGIIWMHDFARTGVNTLFNVSSQSVLLQNWGVDVIWDRAVDLWLGDWWLEFLLGLPHQSRVPLGTFPI